MRNLTIEQLNLIPWNRKYVSGPEVPPEPEIHEIPNLVNIPFMKRNPEYSMFYTWLDIIDEIKGNNLKVLDAACGRGQISQVLQFSGNYVSACDIEDYFCANREKIDFKVQDLNKKWEYQNESFDFVINSTALHYLNSSGHFFLESSRVLKKNGKIVFTIPNINSWAGRYYFFKTGKISEFSSAILERKNFIYPDYIYELLDSLGFQLLSVKGVVPIINSKIKVLDFIIGNKLFLDQPESLRFSSSLVITAKQNKNIN